MKYVITLIAALITLGGMAQVKGIYVEEVNNKGLVPGRTFKIYVEMESRKERLMMVGAIPPPSELYIRSTKPFFQSAYGGPLSANSNRMTLNEKPELRYDSWVTIGYLDNYQNQTAQAALNEAFENFESGGEIYSTDGAWYATPDNRQTKTDANNRVLIAQLTSEGVITGKIDVMGRTVHSVENQEWDNWQIQGLTFTCGGN